MFRDWLRFQKIRHCLPPVRPQYPFSPGVRLLVWLSFLSKRGHSSRQHKTGKAKNMSAANSTKSPRKRQKEIVDAAASVFAQKGFHGASTGDIADCLGIQQAGLYYYFTSKEAALAEVCRIGVDEFLERARDIAASDRSAAEKVTAAVAAHLAPFHSIPDYVEVFHNERRYLSAEMRGPVSQLARSYEAVLEEIFRAGVADQSFRADLDCRLATLGLLGLCNSVLQWYRVEENDGIDDIAHKYAEIIVQGVKT
jgi:TetR/AcrR family transcriptional regulator, cholesterol catabolism regulator